MNELETDDPPKVRAAGVIDLATIQRYLNFHYSVTIDLFGADQSTNAAIFYSAGLKGRYEEGKRADDHVLKGQTLQGARRARRPAGREARCRCSTRSNEVLRDDYIKDSVAGVAALEQGDREGRHPVPPDRAAQGLQPPDRRPGRHARCRPTAGW